MATFEIGEHDFLLDGQPYQVISGALHYFRVHPDHWADRIHKARLMGLNTIETYVAWNFHAPEPGQFRLDGWRDLGRFLDLIAAEGMHAIVRPGPYICAEWDGGGLPAWLHTRDGIGIRRAEPGFLAEVEAYYDALAPVLVPRQVSHGGPVIAVQIENEYGAFGNDPAYLQALVDMVRADEITVPLLTCDQATDEMLERGGLPGLLRTATFGSRATERLELLRRHQSTGPLMCMEFWNGWFDSWGDFHHVAPAATNAGDLDDLLASGASVNLYMFHGGTNFGFTNGANDKGHFRPIATSYDYDAPLAEHGAPTAKYFAMRDVIARHATVPAELPAQPAPAPVVDVELGRRTPLWELLPSIGETKEWGHLPSTDEIGQWSGLTVYTTHVHETDRAVAFGAVHDRAYAFIGVDPVGTVARADGRTTLTLPGRAGTLNLLVENEGRVNYGPRIGEAKGLLGGARTATGEVTEWRTTALRLSELDGPTGDLLAAGTEVDVDAPVAGPTFCVGTFESAAGVDHFLDVAGWGRALVWINGTLLGRISSQGPTRTLYVPGPFVRAGVNRLAVLELTGASGARMRFVAEPDLGVVEP